jgi:hypothetical protein
MNMSFVASVDGVIEAGSRWCRLVSESEWGDWEKLVSDGFTSRHANGKVESKSSCLANFRLHPRTLEMGEATVRQLGTIGVLSYLQKQNIRPRSDSPPIVADTDVVQVWEWTEGRWILSAHWHRMAWLDSRPLETHYRFAAGQIL